MAMTTQQQTDAYRFFVIAFGAAPGVTYMNQIADAYAAGMTTKQIVNVYTTKPQFTAIYPNFYTNTQFANTLVENVVGSSASAAAKAQAKADVEAALNAGWSRGDVIYQVFNNLADKPTTDADWGNTAKMFANKVAVAQYATEVRHVDTTDLSVLQSLLSGVTATTDVSTTAALDAILGATGGYTLTAGNDVATANVFTAPQTYTPGGTDRINSLQDNDQLTGAGNNPTLNATLGLDADTGDTTITPRLSGVETLNVAFDANGYNLDLQDSTGVKSVNMTRMEAGATNGFLLMTAVPMQMSVSNSSATAAAANFTFAPGAAAGTSDTATLKLSNARVTTINITDDATATTDGVENLTVNSVGATNNVGTLHATDVRVLTITGDKNLTIGTINDDNTNGQFTTIDGSAATGNLNLTIDNALNTDMRATTGTGAAVNFRLATGSGDDTINITAGGIIGNAADTVDAGNGNDTAAIRQAVTDTVTDASSAVFNGFEAVTINRGTNNVFGDFANITVDLSRFTGDQTIRLQNSGDAGDTTTFTLNELSATEAGQITIAHSSNVSNGVTNNIIVANLADASGTSDTVGVAIVDGTNGEPRFNFTLTAGGTTPTTVVENVTINDNDTESNTVRLTNAANHTGTITLRGGQAGQFLNLDGLWWGSYGLDLSGNAVDYTNILQTTTVLNAHGALGTHTLFDGANGTVNRTFFNPNTAANTGTELVASTIDASGEASDVIVRVGEADQRITLGAGNDTVIFGDRGAVTGSTSGLTINDTVAGGVGTDTLVFDGTGPQNLGASEWTNLSGIDVLRLAGQWGVTPFTVQVTNQLVDQTDNGSVITIVNNDGQLNFNSEQAATIDLTALNATNFVNFQGPNGDGTAGISAVQTVIVNDVTANGGSTLNGGNADVVTNWSDIGPAAGGHAFATQAAADAAYNAAVGGSVGNNNVYQINSAGTNAQVTVGDLSKTSNFSNIQWVNTDAVAHTLNLTLDSATVDRLVDSNHTANTVARETLNITAVDNIGVPTATANLNVNATSVSSAFNLVLTGGAGNDVFTMGASADVITGGGGADIFRLNNLGVQYGVNVDTVTDFNSGAGDRLDLAFAGTAVGVVYAEAVDAALGTNTAANFLAAKAIAEAAFVGGSPNYYFMGNTDGGGVSYLFVDANGDGTADGAVLLTGVLAADIAATDII